MATAEPLQPSRRLAQAASVERERLLADLAKTEDTAASLRRRLRDAEAKAAAIQQRLQLLEELGVDSGQAAPRPSPKLVTGNPEPRNGWLQGAAIRQVAVRVLAASSAAAEPIHYGRWLDLVRANGYEIQGRDPAATFLTQISRSPVVVRAENPGEYMLDLEADGQLRTRLVRLNDELLALHHGQQTIEQIASARERRQQLISEISQVERQLEEAIEAVGEQDLADPTL